MIRNIVRAEIETCVQVIRKSFETVAREFNLTQVNCPGHTSFIKVEKLYKQYDEGRLMFACLDEDTIVGYFSLVKINAESYELDNLAVLPEYRHKGYGREMVAFAKDKSRDLGGIGIVIGIIEENTRLRKWYENLGFVHTGTKIPEHLPFTTGYMEMVL
jgi:ribosomal protein S18 acetylase RimI-like enzyme